MPVLVEIAVSWTRLRDWGRDPGLALLGILVAMLLLNALLRRVLPPAFTRLLTREAVEPAGADVRKRAETLGSVLFRTAQVIVFAIGVLMVLDQFGYTLAPLLTGLGIGGIAVGLGAQSLVRDTIAGILILIENQFAKGDLVTVAGVTGWVEDINLRRTVLRDTDGAMITVPNGEIKLASNLTRGYSGINFLVPLSTSGDIDKAVAVINAAGDELAADPELGERVLEPARAARVEAITDKGVTIRVLGKAAPGAQFEVAGALRRRIKRGFEREGLLFGEVPPAPAPPAAPPVRPPA